MKYFADTTLARFAAVTTFSVAFFHRYQDVCTGELDIGTYLVGQSYWPKSLSDSQIPQFRLPSPCFASSTSTTIMKLLSRASFRLTLLLVGGLVVHLLGAEACDIPGAREYGAFADLLKCTRQATQCQVVYLTVILRRVDELRPIWPTGDPPRSPLKTEMPEVCYYAIVDRPTYEDVMEEQPQRSSGLSFSLFPLRLRSLFPSNRT